MLTDVKFPPDTLHKRARSRLHASVADPCLANNPLTNSPLLAIGTALMGSGSATGCELVVSGILTLPGMVVGGDLDDHGGWRGPREGAVTSGGWSVEGLNRSAVVRWRWWTCRFLQHPSEHQLRTTVRTTKSLGRRQIVCLRWCPWRGRGVSRTLRRGINESRRRLGPMRSWHSLRLARGHGSRVGGG